jgi:DNA-binding phage protein
MAEFYRDDPVFAVDVIDAILEDKDQAELMVVLRQVARALDGFQSIAQGVS